MFDVGLGEILVLLVLALLVFGPDRLPQVTAQATHWLRQLREQAASARAELADAVDLDSTGLKDLADLHPKRIAASVMAPLDDVAATVKDAGSTVADAGKAATDAVRGATDGVRGSGAAAGSASPSAGSTPSSGPPPSSGSASSPSATSSSGSTAAPFDPDAT